MGGVELHRQRHQLKEGGEGKENDSKQKQRLTVQKQPDQQQDHGQVGPQLRDRDDGRPQPHGAVMFRVLHGMASLMGRHAHRRDGGGVVDCLRQVDGVVPGVVVVRQVPPAHADAHVKDPVGPQHCLCRLGAGDVPAVVDGVVAPEVAGHLELCPQREQQYRNQHQHIEVVGQKVSVAVIAIAVRVEHKTLSLTFQREIG